MDQAQSDLAEPNLGQLPTQKITIHIDDVCGMCKKPLMDKETKTLPKPVMKSETMGVVHDGCFLPFHADAAYKFLIQIRCYSIGDTIAATPVLREVKRIYPKATIHVMTFFPDLLRNNPHVAGILDMNGPIPAEMLRGYHFTMDAFNQEKGFHFAMHSVDFSALCALNRTLLPQDWGYELYYTPADRKRALEVCAAHGIDPEEDRVILIHPHGTEWSTRDWGKHRFGALAKRMQELWPKYKLVSVGGKRTEVPSQEMKNYVEIPGAIDLYGKLTLLESAALMDLPCMKLMVTPDTGALHLAASRADLPIVGIFTLIKAHLRTPTRHGKLGYKFIGVESESGCNCTYNARWLSHESNFYTCPKKKFLEETQRFSLPKATKALGLSQAIPERVWNADKVGGQIRDELRNFRDESLPCFPSVERVLDAIERAINEWG